jgi:hypothetical protein
VGRTECCSQLLCLGVQVHTAGCLAPRQRDS